MTGRNGRGARCTRTIWNSFWHLFKVSIASTHVHISRKHFDKYLREFTFRSNHRARENAMFDLLVACL
jgi:transposase